MSTHDVTNQPPPLVNYNLFDADLPLRESLEREGGSWAHDMVRELGRVAGTEEAIDWPEHDIRRREWVDPADAIDRVQEPGLKEIISAVCQVGVTAA